MKNDEFQEVVDRLKAVNKIILDLDPAIRASAFAVLEPWVTGQPSPLPKNGRRPAKKRSSTTSKSASSKAKATPEESAAVGDNSGLDLNQFFLAFDHKKPSDNVLMVIAWHYNQHGTTPFSVDEICQLADGVGITVPARVDKTITSAQQSGKSCFTKAGKGQFKPTVYGEDRLKRTYGVKKGTQAKPISVESNE